MTAKARASTAQDLNLPSFDKLLLSDKVSAVIFKRVDYCNTGLLFVRGLASEILASGN